MDITRKDLRAAAETAGRRLAEAADDVLIDAGEAAKTRRNRRVAKKALKAIGKAALIAGTVAVTRAAIRRARRRPTPIT
jgi:hypothetical protein